MSLKSVQANELRENLVINVRDFRLLPVLEDVTDMLSRNLVKELPLLAAQMGPVGCPETSIRNCHYSLRNYPEERSYVQAVNSLRNIYIFERVSALHIKSINMLAILYFC